MSDLDEKVRDLRAENARLRKAWEQQGEAWKRDTRDAEKIKGQLSDKLAAAEQREKRLREAISKGLARLDDAGIDDYHTEIFRAALAEGEKP